MYQICIFHIYYTLIYFKDIFFYYYFDDRLFIPIFVLYLDLLLENVQFVYFNILFIIPSFLIRISSSNNKAGKHSCNRV